METKRRPNTPSNQKSFAFSKRLLAWTGLSDKTLWDFLQFTCTAAIPIILTWYGIQQTQLAAQRQIEDQARERDNQLQQIMTNYLDAISAFLLKESAPSSEQSSQDDKARMLAQARTLNTLRQLDPERKGQLLKFLYEAGLVRQCQFDNVLGKVNECQPSILYLGGARLDRLTFEKPMPLPGVNLADAMLPQAILPEIDLTGAQLNGANFKDADLTKAYLSDAEMQNVILQQATLIGAKLTNANLTNAVLEDADLRGANLIKTKLNGAKLGNVKLDNANLQMADLRGADLRGASLDKADFKGAVYSSSTQFPARFNAVVEGMVLDQAQ